MTGRRLDAYFSPLPEGPPVPPESQSRRLPMLLEGNGVRRDDCERMSECLGRLLKRKWTAKVAHCPEVCPSYEPQEAYVRHAMATTWSSPMAALQDEPGVDIEPRGRPMGQRT